MYYVFIGTLKDNFLSDSFYETYFSGTSLLSQYFSVILAFVFSFKHEKLFCILAVISK